MSEQNKQCPEFPFFGASYPDACCINGYLWDLDKCDENGNLYGEGDTPCPFCNTEEFIECDPFSKEDEFYEGIEDMDKAKEKARDWYLNWINSKKCEGMKIRKVKKAIHRFRQELLKSRNKSYILSMSGRIAAMNICLVQLLEYSNKMLYDEQKLHFKRGEYVRYKTLKTAFIKDMIMEGFRELKNNSD